jgi:CubicO group peptidase (beta-lactamase class C family)
MSKILKRILYSILIIAVIAIIGVAIYLNSLLPIITGYAAKNLCSAVFISNRDPENVKAVDLNFSFISKVKSVVNYEDKSVTSRFLWGKSKAIYRDGFGVTLLRDISEDDLRKIKYPSEDKLAYSQDTIKWPLGNIMPSRNTGIDTVMLDEITRKLITDNAYTGNAFAFMVLHKGIPVAESYKPQFNSGTRFLSWSMAKSFINAFVGILVKDGKLDIQKPAGLDEWKNDDRSKITLNDIMQMQSGLKWNEDYGNRSDVTLMLHCESDMGHFALNREEAFAPGAHWYYSSGSTNLVSYMIRHMFNNDSLYYTYVDNRLFRKIGAPDAIMEVDASGTRVGSSYLYATARDYARLALLYMNDGVFNGERILPEGWVKYSTTPASDSKGAYGSFFWLNRGKEYSAAPEDMFMCVGHDGQLICMVPSKEIVVVVLGYSPLSKGGMDFNRLLGDVLATVK